MVMSGDSRTTATRRQQVPDPQDSSKQMVVQTDIVLSDAAEKLFLLHGRFGVGISGDAFLNDLPIAHYVHSFQAKAATPPTSVQNLSNDLLLYFRSLQPIPKLTLHVMGYDSTTPFVFEVVVATNKVQRWNIDPTTNQAAYGILRSGDTAVVDRLLSQPQFTPAFQVMNVQDAVDYSRHLIRTTIDQLRFEPRFSTVGGEIDTLVVTSSEGHFLARKALHVSS
jgi:hypothetical protein